MNSSESLTSIAPALAKAQAEFKSVAKSGENKFDHYSYANLEDYVRAVRPVLAAHGIGILSSVEEVVQLDDRPTQKGGNEHAVRVKLIIRLVHESGEWIEAAAWGEGQDRADKATYKAITGARKYGLASALGLATSDDPEADDDGAPPAKPAQRGAQPRQPEKPSTNGHATPEQVTEIKRLLGIVKLAEGTTDKWLAKAGVDSWDKMPRDAMTKSIAYLRVEEKKKPPVYASDDPKILWEEFVKTCEQAAEGTGLPLNLLQSGMKKVAVALKLVGKEWEMPESNRVDMLKAITNGEGYFAVPETTNA